jgi:acyl-CoA thioester hydrolase
VEFAETDAAGMVHFSVFFRYMEEAEHAVWRRAGLDIFANHEERSWPRISAGFDFKAPLKFQDEFEVHTEIGPVSRSTIQWVHVIKRGDAVIGTGTVTAVHVAKNRDGSMKSAEIPADITLRLRAALQAPAS